MNKTVTANISGVVFHIEADAYEKLNKYLNTIRTYFRDSDGTDEIMADIEARIAELFKESMDMGKEVVTDANVNRVIEVMGEPEQYMDEETAENFSDHSESTNQEKTTYQSFRSKKLFRDSEDNVIGGVCSGLGHYFGVDRIWFRAAFLIALFGFGTGFLLYLILWVIIPAPKTTAEKLEMKGEPINVENIGNAIKDEFNGFKKKVNDKNPGQYGRKAENAIFKFFDFLGKLLYYLIKFVAKVIGAAFVIVSVIGIFSLITVIVGGPFAINTTSLNLENNWISEYAEVFFTSSSLFYLGIIGLFFILFIPLLGILYGGLKMLFKIPSSTKTVGIVGVSLFIIGAILISVVATTTAADYSRNQQILETVELTEITNDTINLSTLDNVYASNQFGDLELTIDGKEIYINCLQVDVKKSGSENFELMLKKTALGSNRKEARKRAENILYSFQISANTLEIDPVISVPYEDKFRGQELDISIGVPIGKSIFLEQSSRELIYDIKNVTRTYDGKMIGHHWMMTKKGLKCTDCEWMEKEEKEEQTETMAL